MMETLDAFEHTIITYKNTWRRNTEGHNFHCRGKVIQLTEKGKKKKGKAIPVTGRGGP
jgi:hypothetical protein